MEDEQPLPPWSVGWIPEKPVPCSNDPDAWADGDIYGRSPSLLNMVRSICSEKCPVREECLDRALEEEGSTSENHRFGIRGGLTPKQRYRIFTANLLAESGSL